MSSTNPTAFDAFAPDYDATFTHTRLGQMLRPRVWRHLSAAFAPGQHVLELACGTGEDAVWLAQQGVRVTATDGSAEMVAKAKAKAKAEAEVIVEQVSLQDIIAGHFEQVFDGVYSNFGGLNTIDDWRPLAKALAKIVRPGGKVVLVPMGPFCPWEILWHLGHGQVKTAFRRFGGQAIARIGGAGIPIWYPPARRLQADFSPWFRHLRTESLELWTPPSYLGHLVDRWPGFFERLNRFEAKTAHITKGWGDHYICILEKLIADS